MRKKLASLLCVFVLSGCSHTVQGRAIQEDAWHGRGVVPSDCPSFFDPCGFDDSVLTYYVEVDPSTKVELPGGCQWRGEGIAFTAAALPDEDVDLLAAQSDVDELAEIESSGRSARVFVLYDKMCMALTEVGGGLAQFMLIEDRFDSSCFDFRVIVRLLLIEL